MVSRLVSMKTSNRLITFSFVGALVLFCTVACVSINLAEAAGTPAPTATPASTSVGLGDLTKATPDAIEKDLRIACEMSKLAQNLAKTSVFKNDRADLAYRVAELMSAAFKTPEVKDAYRTIVVADPKTRVDLWHQVAKDGGVKGFSCKTIGFNL